MSLCPSPSFIKRISLSTKQIEIALFLIVLSLECLAFYKLGHFNQTLPIWNDNINITLPNRVYLDNAIKSGAFPFFDFLSGSGVPFVTLYTSSGLSPLTILLATIFSYSTKIMLIEIFCLNVIAFSGMYFWIRKISNRSIALIAASSFTLGTSVIGQSLANLEAVGTTAALPWIFLGLLNIYKSKKNGIFQLAGGLGFAFTHGYLGLNLLISVLTSIGILIFGGTELFKKLQSQKSFNLKMLKRPSLFLALGIILFIGTIFPLITETFQNFSKTIYVDREVNPFTASMRAESWVTLFDPLNVRGQEPDEFGGFYANLFVPVVFLIGIAGIIHSKKKIYISSLLLTFISYATLLPENFWISRFLVNLLPLFDSIRFHSWASIFVIFLILSFGSVGLRNILNVESKKLYLALATVPLILIVGYLNSLTLKYFIILVSSTIFTAICIYLISINNKTKLGLKVWAMTILFLIAFGQMILADKRVGSSQSPFSKIEQKQILDLAIAGQATWPINNVSREGLFSVLGQYPNQLVGNQHLYLNKPVNISYTPQMNPRVLDANTGRGLPTLEPFIVDQSFNSLDYLASLTSPNELNLKLNEFVKENAIIQITYSRNFKVFVNGQQREIYSTDENFIGLNLDSSDKYISIQYSPFLPLGQLLISSISWIFIFSGAIIVQKRKLSDQS